MSNPYNVLDLPAAPLALTDSYAEYLRERVTKYDSDIAEFDKAEQSLLANLESCRAVRQELMTSRQRYARRLAAHNQPAGEQRQDNADEPHADHTSLMDAVGAGGES